MNSTIACWYRVCGYLLHLRLCLFLCGRWRCSSWPTSASNELVPPRRIEHVKTPLCEWCGLIERLRHFALRRKLSLIRLAWPRTTHLITRKP
ncbi:hypothetical protein J2W51_003150 [Tardiphaga robiniae]|nr:hypothetical protein [Tardiphaga robiniae]